VENHTFHELNGDQRREFINTRLRYAAYRDAVQRNDHYRGSMGWKKIHGRDYLVRSYYGESGIRRQTSLGLRSKNTEAIKLEHDRNRSDAQQRFRELKTVMSRQGAINRALSLGRVPLVGAKIIRAIDEAGMIGRVHGAYAIYAYEAAAGVHIEPGLTATEDIDFLFDARQRLTFVEGKDASELSLRRLRQKHPGKNYQIQNRECYLFDLVKSPQAPRRTKRRDRLGTDEDLTAAVIEELAWQESAPSFEATAIDERGEACRILTIDPRVWTAHKFWLSKRKNRESAKRRNDAAQARAVGQLVAQYMQHLPYVADELRMLPKQVFNEAKPLFTEP